MPLKQLAVFSVAASKKWAKPLNEHVEQGAAQPPEHGRVGSTAGSSFGVGRALASRYDIWQERGRSRA